jgi:hypothetical protein
MSESETTDIRCSECNIPITGEMDREDTGDGIFCRNCYDALAAQLNRALEKQGEGIDYTKATIGGILGGALGILVWWGITVITDWSIGIVAIAIGFAVGKGILILTGGRRSSKLQILSVGISVVSFLYASYLVTRSFLLEAFAGRGELVALPVLPDPILCFRVLQAGFQPFDLVFLAIVIYEAWKIPAPVRLQG